MRRRTLIALAAFIFISLILHVEQSAFAQAEGGQAALKFDEFGDIQYSDLIARLDNFAVQLQNEPGRRGFLIVYRTQRDLPGLSNRYAQRMKTYLVRSRGLSKERIITVDGGVAYCLTQELWIVPPGTAPKPRSDAYSRVFVDRDAARKFDEFSFYSPLDENEVGGYTYLEDEANLEAFAEALRSEPRARAHIIVYAQHYIERGVVDYANGRSRSYNRPHIDPPGIAQKELRNIKNALIKIYRVAPARISMVVGGYRKERQVELWIVPPGEATPIATPSSFPRRKGRS